MSGEVDVAAQTSLACPFEQSHEGRSLLRARSPPDEDDDAVMGLLLRQGDEVVAIAGHEQMSAIERAPKHRRVRGFRAEHVTDAQHSVIEFAQQVGEVFGDVLIEQEGHDGSADAAICRATSRSISPRWSS